MRYGTNSKRVRDIIPREARCGKCGECAECIECDDGNVMRSENNRNPLLEIEEER